MTGPVAEYKQPHEDVVGTDRTADCLLSLDDAALAHRDALVTMARLLQDACTVGNPAPIVQRMGERIRTPRVGDLVVETSAVWTRDTDRRVMGFGFLVERRREFCHTDEQWHTELAEDPETYEGEPRPTDEAWYVQYGQQPVDVCRWTNCSFVVLPIADDFRSVHGQRDPSGGVTVTRGDLLASLADSGIQLRTVPAP